MIRLIIIILAIYLLYKFIFEFVLPIYRTSRRMHQQFRGMQDKMNQNMHSASDPYQKGAYKGTNPQKSKAGSKDYIDFEEVK